MNKFIAIAAILSVAGFAQAQSTTTPKLRPGMMMQNNREAREDIRTEKKDTIKGIKEDMREKMASTSVKNMMGTTTRGMMGERKEERKEIRQTARKDVALAEKDALVKRLTLALENLVKAKTSISSIIDKRVADGKAVGDAKKLLETASTKIEIAKKAVLAIVAWKPDTKSASSTEISLTKPRETANAAIKATQEARKAIDVVIREMRSQSHPEEKRIPGSATSTNQ